MTYPFSRPDAGVRLSATVKWYDPTNGYGFLVPGDGSPDIYCGKAALAAVGLDTLFTGATVACETAPGRRGPEVSRIHARATNGSRPEARRRRRWCTGWLIPTVIDQNPCAHLRMPRDMIFHGWSMRLFQAWQHSATMSS